MFKKAVLLGLALGCLIGCASQKMWYGDVQSGIRLRHQLISGDSTIYFIKSTTRDSMKLMAKMNTSVTEVNSRFSHRILAQNKNDAFEIAANLDSISIKSDHPNLAPIQLTMNDAIKSFLNRKMQLRISRLGEVLAGSSIDSLIPPRLLLFVNPQHAVRLCYPGFSKNPVKPGEKWETISSLKRNTSDLKIKVKCQTISTFEKTVPGDTCEFAEIAFSGKYEISGQGRQLNILARIEGIGTIAGRYLFDYQRGRFLGGDFSEQIQFKYFFPGVESMPVIQNVHIQTKIALQK